jgi:hypothetical protein
MIQVTNYPLQESRNLAVGAADSTVLFAVDGYQRVAITVKNTGTAALTKLTIAMRSHSAGGWITFVNSEADYTTPVVPLVKAANASFADTSAYTLAAGAEVTLFFDFAQYAVAQLQFTAAAAANTTLLFLLLALPS